MLNEQQINFESVMDHHLIRLVCEAMENKLNASRESGRYGWWDPEVITIGQLYYLRDQAINQGDHVSVLNYTAFILARESRDMLNGDFQSEVQIKSLIDAGILPNRGQQGEAVTHPVEPSNCCQLCTAKSVGVCHLPEESPNSGPRRNDREVRR